MSTNAHPDMTSVLKARARLEGRVRRTPMIISESLTRHCKRPVHLKLEHHQITGSFKLRGAMNAVLSLSEQDRARGVTAASTGNHGRGLAYAAKQAGARAVICMSKLVPKNKVEGIERLGADITENKVVFNEMLDMIDQGLRQPHFSYDGEKLNQLQTAINVQPVQSPRPPIWIAGADPNSHRRCARDGFIPFISGGIESPERIRAMRDQIERCYVEEGKDPSSIPLGVLRFVCVSDDKAVLDRYVDGARFQKRIAMSLRHRKETMVDDYMVAEEPFENEPALDQVAENIVVGNAEQVAERLCREIELYGPRHMNNYFAVGDVPHLAVMNSIEQFATKVVPLIEAHFGKPLDKICDAPMPTPVPLAAE